MAVMERGAGRWCEVRRPGRYAETRRHVHDPHLYPSRQQDAGEPGKVPGGDAGLRLVQNWDCLHASSTVSWVYSKLSLAHSSSGA